MADKKQQKKKDRERRVAEEKLAATAQKRTQAKTASETKKPVSRKVEVMTRVAVPKADPVVSTNKPTFSHRRTGG